MRKPCFEVYSRRQSTRRYPTQRWRLVWRWRLKGANGEIVAQGESYGRKADCLRAVKAIKRLAAEAVIR